MGTRVHNRLRRFAAAEDGALSVEAVIIFPILLWAFIAMFVFWDAFKAQNINLKATYTVADLISREDDPIDAAYVDGMNDVYEFLIARDDGNDLRVSVVSVGLEADGVTPDMQLEWSYATGTWAAIDDIALLEPMVPLMSVGDQLIVVESQMEWTPVMSRVPLVGRILDARTMDELVFTAPRFVPQVIWDDGTGT